MKNSLFLIIAVAVMTITLLGCQTRNQKVNTSKNEFSKDSCMIVTFADSLEFRYQLVVDSTGIKMANSVQKVFISDIRKHGPFNFKDVHVTDDIIEYCRGKSFEVRDSINYKLYRFQFAEPPTFILSDKINPTFGDVDINVDIN